MLKTMRGRGKVWEKDNGERTGEEGAKQEFRKSERRPKGGGRDKRRAKVRGRNMRRKGKPLPTANTTND